MSDNLNNGNVLCGHQAAKELDRYIKQLEKRKVEGLTEKQVKTLIKTAKVIRNAVNQPNSQEVHQTKNKFHSVFSKVSQIILI